MASQLSSEQISQLAPLLGSLARLIAGHGEIADEQLQLLLAVTDLDAHPTALAEIKLWSRLLSRSQIAPSPALRQTIVEALLMRGLPEASVLLAVATVGGSGTGSTQTTAVPVAPTPARLQASVSSLDFGSLRPGQGATQELEVQGGPGHVSVESDHVQVTPTQFGARSTRLRVELRPLTSGLLWTTIKLMTAGETLEVSVTAQWQDGDTAPAKLLLNPLIQPPQPSTATPLPQQNPRQPQPLIQQPPPPATVVPQPARQLMLEVPVVPVVPIVPITPSAQVLVPPPARSSAWAFLLIPLLIILVMGGVLMNVMMVQSRKSLEASRLTTAAVYQMTADTQASTKTASDHQTTLAVAATTATEVAQLTETALAQAATETALAQAAIETALAQVAIETALAQAAIETTTIATEHPTIISTTFSTVLPNGGHLYRLPSREPGMALGLIWPGDEVLCLGEEFENGNGRWIYVRVVKASPDRGSGGVPEGSEGYARATLISTP